MNKPKKKLEPVTHIITDVDEMSFNKEHDLWWHWSGNENDEVIDMDSYDEFMSFTKKVIGEYLDDGYSVVAHEEEFIIRFTFIKGKVKKNMVIQCANQCHQLCCALMKMSDF